MLKTSDENVQDDVNGIRHDDGDDDDYDDINCQAMFITLLKIVYSRISKTRQ